MSRPSSPDSVSPPARQRLTAKAVPWLATGIGLIVAQISASAIRSPHLAALIAGLLTALPLVLWMRRERPPEKAGPAEAALYGSSFVHSGAPLLLLHPDGRVISMSHTARRLLGLDETGVAGQMIAALVPDAWRGHFLPRPPDKPGLPYWSDLVPLTAPDGTPQSFLLQSQTLHTPESPPAILTVCIDLTQPMAERRQREELIQRGRDYVQHLINVIPQPVYVRDQQSRYLMVNEAFAAIYARTPEQICGLAPGELLDDPAHVTRSILEDQAVLSGRTVFNEVTRPYGVSREERCLVVSKGPCRTPEGQAVIVGAHFDVTKWRLAERQLREALEREVSRHAAYQAYVQRLIDVIPHPVYVKDQYSRCLLANEAYASLLILDRDMLPGRASTQGVSADTAQLILQEDAEVLAGRFIQKEESDKRFPADPSKRYRVITKGRCFDPEGEPVIVCSMFDVTEWRHAEERWMLAKEEAERANEAKTLFLANMSHELRTPLHAVLSFARLGMTRTESTPELGKEHGYFERIVRSGERLLSLLNDLLDLAKLEDGHHPALTERFEIGTVLNEVVAEFAALLESRRLHLDVQMEDALVAVGDPSLIGQLVRNLLSNAIKFSPKDSHIRLMAHPAQLQLPEHTSPLAGIEIRVADHGVGIPETELELIFDKFVQSSKTLSGAGGTGLGLSICREIVRQHGGEIFARNRPSGGAEFVARIPAAPKA